MPASSTKKRTRRQAIHDAGRVLAGAASLNALPLLSGTAGSQERGGAPLPEAAHTSSTDKLRIATCQFPVSGSPPENAKWIRDFMRRAAKQGAHLLHTSEASLSGYAGCDLPTFDHYDWGALRQETSGIRTLAHELNLWLVLGSSHFLGETWKPTDCQYLIDPTGRIVDRYDKCFCTGRDHRHYSAGNRLVTHIIRGVKVGLAICYDICWPQLYTAYRKHGVTVMIHSMSNARDKAPSALDSLNVRAVPTRCSDNQLWAVVNNASNPYSHWGSFIARPDTTIPKQLPMNHPGC